jgi:hypothetical protein
MSKQTIIWAVVLVAISLGFGLFLQWGVNKAVNEATAKASVSQADPIQVYRKAMKDGAAIAAIGNATTICASLKCSPKDLQEMKVMMGSVAMARIDALPDSFIIEIMNTHDKDAEPTPTDIPKKGEVSI